MNKAFLVLFVLSFVVASSLAQVRRKANQQRQATKAAQQLDCFPQCQNGGTCVQNPNNPFRNVCKCTANWMGSACNLELYCPFPCQNGGVCAKSTLEMPVCQCPSGYTGLDCSITAPCGLNCKNAGRCVFDLNTKAAKCICAPGYTGSDCSTMVNNCAGKNPCPTAFAKCIPVPNSYVCTPANSQLACNINGEQSKFGCLTSPLTQSG